VGGGQALPRKSQADPYREIGQFLCLAYLQIRWYTNAGGLLQGDIIFAKLACSLIGFIFVNICNKHLNSKKTMGLAKEH